MVKSPPKPPAKDEEQKPAPTAVQEWEPLDTLRRQVDRLFDEFHHSFPRLPFGRSLFDPEPFWRHVTSWGGVPAVAQRREESREGGTAERLPPV